VTTDPLSQPRPLIERVYAYVAYRIGDGVEAEDVTSEVFERAVRYRASFDPSKGQPLTWLLGIATRCIHDRPRQPLYDEVPDVTDRFDLENDVVRRLSVTALVSKLDDRERELVGLRYGADLTARQIAGVLGMKTNAVEVALHRALERLRVDVAHGDAINQGVGPRLRASSTVS
jgi:RNA polymerase sigma-70 factor (ECF subfamily)